MSKLFEISRLIKKINIFEGVLKELVADAEKWNEGVEKYSLFTGQMSIEEKADSDAREKNSSFLTDSFQDVITNKAS